MPHESQPWLLLLFFWSTLVLHVQHLPWDEMRAMAYRWVKRFLVGIFPQDGTSLIFLAIKSFGCKAEAATSQWSLQSFFLGAQGWCSYTQSEMAVDGFFLYASPVRHQCDVWVWLPPCMSSEGFQPISVKFLSPSLHTPEAGKLQIQLLWRKHATTRSRVLHTKVL